MLRERIHEGIERAQEPLARGARCVEGGSKPFFDAAEHAAQQLEIELDLAPEVMEEGGLAEADGAGDLAQTDTCEAAPRKERLGDVEDLVPGARRIERLPAPQVRPLGLPAQQSLPRPLRDRQTVRSNGEVLSSRPTGRTSSVLSLPRDQE
ncbi:MAG TPA: hypothetical protein VEG67_07465 [Myxococcota bacterium]|nr:hypothetical protein [Myxococcota bacterium]